MKAENVMFLSAKDREWCLDRMEKFFKKMGMVAPRTRDKLPATCRNGIYDNKLDEPDGEMYWTNGFWGGMMWLLYEQTKDEVYKELAIHSEELLDKALAKTERLTHDVGFMWHLTSGAHYRICGDVSAKRKNLAVANALAARFHVKGGFIRALNEEEYPDGDVSKGMTIIDTMMNLPLLYWASAITKDERYKDIAMVHADTTMHQHLRADGSVNHIVLHDVHTGEMTGTRGGQGFREGSSWSRGQGWAIYGFALSYKHTGEIRYLDAAKAAAHYFISCVCDDYLPKSDFRAPKEPVVYDSTAGAIAACGLLEIASHAEEYEAEVYSNAALKICKAMDEKFCNYSEDNDSILTMATNAYGGERHVRYIYGDYFWLEALTLLGGGNFNGRVLLNPFSECGLRNTIFFAELRLSFSVLVQRNKGFFKILVIFGIIVVTHLSFLLFLCLFIISYFAYLCLLF